MNKKGRPKGSKNRKGFIPKLFTRQPIEKSILVCFLDDEVFKECRKALGMKTTVYICDFVKWVKSKYLEG